MATPTVKEILDAIAPQFPDDATRDLFITLAEARTNACFYKPETKYNMAVAYMTAHLMTLKARDEGGSEGGVGPVTSKKEGDLSVSYGGSTSSSAGPSDLESTNYGMSLKGLRKGSGPFMGVTGHWDKEPPALEGFGDCEG